MTHAAASNDTLRTAPRFALLAVAAVLLCGVPTGQLRADGAADVTSLATVIESSLVSAVQEGLVSWYGAAFHNRRTASGELFDSGSLTMAHPTLPFGTHVKVTNVRNGRSVVVRVNDRGPFVGTRIADLSRAAAEQLGMLRRGVVKARIEVVDDATAGASR